MFDRISEYAASQTPFLFFTDYLGTKAHVYRLDELEQHGIAYALHVKPACKPKSIQKYPITFEEYEAKFNRFIEEIKKGNTYLGNLTQPTPIQTNLSLQEIFEFSDAPYKLHVKDRFVCFSPEPFITIEGNTISTFPMKGTIDAAIHHAKAKILANKKEIAEHTMIVDLLRNDLSMVASNVRVKRFKYVQKIRAGEKELLHVSSEIEGTLSQNWQTNFGNIIKTLLPAGSISGTPKISTVKILDSIEGYQRRYFSGVFGVFDGKKFESAVMIRFIEEQDKQLVYKSGGGITLDSDAASEYQEMIDKVYIP